MSHNGEKIWISTQNRGKFKICLRNHLVALMGQFDEKTGAIENVMLLSSLAYWRHRNWKLRHETGNTKGTVTRSWNFIVIAFFLPYRQLKTTLKVSTSFPLGIRLLPKRFVPCNERSVLSTFFNREKWMENPGLNLKRLWWECSTLLRQIASSSVFSIGLFLGLESGKI